MTERQTPPPPDETVKRQVFLALVTAQDGGMGTAESRAATAAQFGLTEDAVRLIAQEGIEAGWPPLND